MRCKLGERLALAALSCKVSLNPGLLTDFSLHLLLVAAWMIYRSRSWVVGIICAILAINLGGVFTLAYLIVVSVQAKGDMRKVLLGARQIRESPLL